MKIQLPQLFHSLEGRKPGPIDLRFVQIQLFKLFEEPEPAESLCRRCLSWPVATSEAEADA